MPYKIKDDADKRKFIELLHGENFILSKSQNAILISNPSNEALGVLKNSSVASEASLKKGVFNMVKMPKFSEEDLKEIKKIRNEQIAKKTRGDEASTTSDQPQNEAACDNLPSLTPDLRENETDSCYEDNDEEAKFEDMPHNSTASYPSTILNEAQEQAALPSAQTEASAGK